MEELPSGIEAPERSQASEPASIELQESSFGERIRRIREVAGRLVLGTAIAVGGMEAAARSTAEQSREQITMTEAVEGKDGTLSAERMTKILRDTYPKGWFDGVSVRVKPYIGEAFPKWTQASETALPAADAIENLFQEGSTITLRPSQLKHNSLEHVVGRILSHESGHAATHEMPASQWEAIRAGIINRLQEPDRLESPHVALMPGTSADIETQAEEYWAEIVGQYFQDPTQLNIKDFRVVDVVVKQKDATFDALQKANERRIEMLKNSITS